MSKREELRERRRRQQQRQRYLIIIGIAVLAVAVVTIIIINNINNTPPAGPTGPVTPAPPIPHPQANGLSLGDPNAPVKVIEYADFQCPGCKTYFNALEASFVSTYIATGKVFYTFHPFSFIDEFPGAKGNESHHAAEAAYCASDQNKFWDMHDLLFSNQGAENTGNFSNQRLVTLAAAAGLDMTQFNTCFNSHKYQQKVLDDEKSANQAGVSQTPTFSVNGQLVTVDKLTTTIDGLFATSAPTK